ncbi:MAG: hypothetical protein RO257_02625, partial [Candidatus Kapabacteria bacterium]|nr:hypothetical protein [Candidatus Kapabacteria bacterium]
AHNNQGKAHNNQGKAHNNQGKAHNNQGKAHNEAILTLFTQKQVQKGKIEMSDTLKLSDI